jgi:hypothetical protein
MATRIESFKELLEEFVGFQKADRLHREKRTRAAPFLHRVQIFLWMFSSIISADIALRTIEYLFQRYKEETFHRIPLKKIWSDHRKCSEILSGARLARLILAKASETPDRWSSLFKPKYDYLLNPFIAKKLQEEGTILTRVREFIVEEEPTRIVNALKSSLCYSVVRWLYDSGEGILSVSTAKETFMEPESSIYSAFDVLDREKIIERPVPSMARPGPKFDEAVYAMLFSEYFVTKLNLATKSLRLLLFAMTPATIINEDKIGPKTSFHQIAKLVRKEINLPIYVSSTKLFRPIVVTTDNAASALNLPDLSFAQRLYGHKKFETKEIFRNMRMHKPLSEKTKIGEALEKFKIVYNGIVPLNFEHLVSTNEHELKCVELELVI